MCCEIFSGVPCCPFSRLNCSAVPLFPGDCARLDLKVAGEDPALFRTQRRCLSLLYGNRVKARLKARVGLGGDGRSLVGVVERLAPSLPLLSIGGRPSYPGLLSRSSLQKRICNQAGLCCTILPSQTFTAWIQGKPRLPVPSPPRHFIGVPFTFIFQPTSPPRLSFYAENKQFPTKLGKLVVFLWMLHKYIRCFTHSPFSKRYLILY